LRFLADQSGRAERLADQTPASLPEDPNQGGTGVPAEVDPGLPRWLAILHGVGLVDVQTLTTARQVGAGDEEQVTEWLITQGGVAARDVVLARAQAYDLPYVEPAEYRVHIDNRKLVREDLARAHNLFPLFALERIITLAVARPLDLAILDQIRLQTGCEVDCCLASPRELQHLIEWAYGGFHESTASVAPAADLVWSEILKDVADAPVVKLVDVLLDRAATCRASDIHIDSEETTLRVRFRVDGVLREVPAPPKSLLPAIISRIKILAHLDIAETRHPQDGHFKLGADEEQIDVRVSTMPSTNGEAVVLRLLRSGARLLSLEELGMPPTCLAQFDRLIHLPHGMILVTGPTGSGKTTTLYSAIARLDRVRQSIVTLEDPVEIRLPQVRQVSVQPKAGLTFQSGLRAILRQDPDCIMVGEIRDRETAEIALQAALTGHIVLSTLHTNSAAAATTRLLDMGLPDFLVASALVGVLAQRLCRRLCTHCARSSRSLPRGMESVAERLIGDAPHMEAVGCKRCGNTGYEGRVGVYELLVVTDEIRRAVFARQDDHAIAQLAVQQGMRTLILDGAEKVRRGLTTLTEVLRVVGRLDGLSGTGLSWGSRRARPNSPGRDFDVASYEQLLSQWLRPEPASVPAEPGRSA
jgi:type II secretory ATPase GspE/PulE/Tfp pilus assembly ATPase PilB-like protein